MVKKTLVNLIKRNNMKTLEEFDKEQAKLRLSFVIFSIKNFIHMKKELTKKDYDNFMKVVNQSIKETERRLETFDKTKKVSQLSFEDWVKFQNGELKIS